MIVITYEQHTPEWFAARRGLPTASEFASIITPKKREYAAAADAYINALIDELARPAEAEAESFAGNRHTRRGEMLEPEALGAYAFDRGNVRLQRVGLVLSPCRRFGCSPDALVGADGLVQAKAPDGHTFVRWFREFKRTGALPDEHKPQVHGELIITGRQWSDFVAHCPGYPQLVIRVQRDEFTAALERNMELFHRDYTAALELFELRHPGPELEALPWPVASTK